MNAYDNHMMNILYSPIMYIHSDRLQPLNATRDVLNDLILNFLIINYYELDDLPDNWRPDDSVSIFIFTHWNMIPKAANLIGNFLLRERLLVEKIPLLSDEKILAFISLPLRHSVVVNPQYQTADYCTLGAAFISGLTNTLPAALQERLSLCFPKDLSLPAPYIARTPDNFNLLKMAFKYAYDTQK